jgi:hypothetical protein
MKKTDCSPQSGSTKKINDKTYALPTAFSVFKLKRKFIQLIEYTSIIK